MAVIKLQVKGNFEDAQKQIEGLGDAVASEAKRMDAAMKKLSGTQLDAFTQKNQRAAAAVTATDGKIAGLAAQSRGLKTQIQKMIRAGYDPQSEALKDLQTQYEKTSKDIEVNTKAQKMNSDIMKTAKIAAAALAAAVVAGGVAMIKNTFDVATAGDQYAKTARSIGITAEELQELQFVADRSGVSNESLNTSLKKLNKNVGDVRAGTGSLTTLLKAQNPELLAQLKTVQSNEEAFSLLIGELEGMENVTDRATLAQAAFGKAGQDLINVAELGADGIAELRQEAQSYGLISNEAAAASEEFIDAQTNAQAAVQGLKNAMAEKLMPAITSVMNGFTAFITDSERMKRTLDVLVPVLSGIAAGLLAFLVITKVVAIVQGFSTAMAVLNTVLLANPVLLIAAGVALLVAGIVVLYKNWDKVVVYMSTTMEKLKVLMTSVGASLKLGWITALNSIQNAFLDLGIIILDKVMGAVNELLSLAARLPVVGDKFAGLQSSVNGFAQELRDAKDAATDTNNETIRLAQEEQRIAKQTADAKIDAINQEQEARLSALKEQEEQNKQQQSSYTAPELAAGSGSTGSADPTGGESLSTRLSALNNAEAIANAERLSTYSDFLSARMDQENIAGEERIAFLQEELTRIQELNNISAEERVAAEQTVSDKIGQIQAEQMASEKAMRESKISGYASMFGSMSDIMTEFAGDSVAAAAAAKGLASAQAAINSYLAFTQVLADPTLPFLAKAVSAGSILASGLSQQANILSTSVSAETGGDFTVPDSGRVDGTTMKVNQGEEVSVTPRGESSSKSITVNNYMDKELFWSITQEGIDQNEINITSDNVRSA